MTVKGRLRAKARKKARKAQKKKGSGFRKKVCRFCADATVGIDYKDPKGLRYFLTETGKLIPSPIWATPRRGKVSIAIAMRRGRSRSCLLRLARDVKLRGRIEVILREDIPRLGDAGEVVNVRPASRNFLLSPGQGHPRHRGEREGADASA